MKNFYLTLFFISLFFQSSFSQTIFHENFENPDSVISTGTNGWNLYSQAHTSGFFCDSASGAPNDSVMLTTISFSTLGSYHVILKFNQICTFDANKNGVVEVSANNGF